MRNHHVGLFAHGTKVRKTTYVAQEMTPESFSNKVEQLPHGTHMLAFQKNLTCRIKIIVRHWMQTNVIVDC